MQNIDKKVYYGGMIWYNKYDLRAKIARLPPVAGKRCQLTKREELNAFLEKADELIEGNYILADIKIAGLLKTIASSDTLLAIFGNCLSGFDYAAAKKKYLVGSKYLPGEKGEFIMPASQRDLLAFVFTLLVDIDAKRVDFGDFLNKYFYEDGSFSSGYAAFINAMIKPFRSAVGNITESVMEGRVQDPVEAAKEEEKNRAIRQEELKKEREKEKELSGKTYAENVKKIKAMLLEDKSNIKAARISERAKNELTLAVDMLANVIDSGEKDAVLYAFVAYKYCAKSHKILFFGRVRKIKSLLKGTPYAV